MLTVFDIQELLSEQEPTHWLIDEDADLNASSELLELLQTGSVTVQIGSRRIVIALHVEERDAP